MKGEILSMYYNKLLSHFAEIYYLSKILLARFVLFIIRVHRLTFPNPGYNSFVDH
jgi:hypothetical protein